MKNAPFICYEEVEVTPTTTGLDEVAGARGVLLSIHPAEASWSCAVLLYKEDRVWSIDAADLKSTGRFRTRAEFYRDSILRVSAQGHVIADSPSFPPSTDKS
jgi:hypothetical protein